MMGFFGRLFGTEAAAEKLVETTAAGLDKLFYTGEEKVEDAMEMRKWAGKMFIEWQKNTQGQNLSRRILALSIAGTWLFQYWASMMINIASAFISDPGLIDSLQQASMAVSNNADSMTGAMMLLLGFYFAAPHMDKLVSAAMEKFSGVKI